MNTMPEEKMQNRIREVREAQKLSLEELAQRIGTSRQQVHKLEKGERKLTQEWMWRIANALEVNPLALLPPDFAAKTGLDPLEAVGYRVEEIDPETHSKIISGAGHQATVLEIDVRAGLGGGGEAALSYSHEDGQLVARDGIKAHWDFPAEYLRSEVRAHIGSSRIVEVIGDSMSPTLLSGDRVMVDMRDKVPTPPGIFALWDGMGVVVKRIEHIPHSDPPRIRISSDNQYHPPYERTAEEVRIIGRVVWFSRRL
ncbi:MAG: LexA family transcriptional regulator [Pseudomonadota bacterium]